jgi:hypothetical protein
LPVCSVGRWAGKRQFSFYSAAASSLRVEDDVSGDVIHNQRSDARMDLNASTRGLNSLVKAVVIERRVYQRQNLMIYLVRWCCGRPDVALDPVGFLALQVAVSRLGTHTPYTIT